MEVLKVYITQFILVLIGLGITSFVTDVVIAAPEDRDFFGSSIIFTMVLISGTMTLIQSVRSNQAAEKLKSLVKITATKDLFISQSALTGESYPVEKRAKMIITQHNSETSYENLVFMGSNIISGTAEGVVIATGNNTLFGNVAKSFYKAYSY